MSRKNSRGRRAEEMGVGRAALMGAIALLGFAGAARGGDEVWVHNNSNCRIYRYDPSGAALGDFAANCNGSTVRMAMDQVGNEVWTHNNSNCRMYRYGLNAVSLGDFAVNCNGSTVHMFMTTFGNEVWLHNNSNCRMYRYSFTGVSLGDFAVNCNGSTVGMAITAFGNEVWAHNNSNCRIYRYGPGGTSLGDFPANCNGSTVQMAITTFGDEVWVHNNSNCRIYRYGAGGVSLGDFAANCNGSTVKMAMTTIGNEVWLHNNSNCRIYRYGPGGVSLGDFAANCNGSTVGAAMTAVEAADCNTNGVSDFDDIAGPTSADCNTNVIPDECDIANNSSDDCNTDGIPDECQTDCNNNDIPDNCDLLSGFSEDCNTNFIPDECDIAGPTSVDCNANQIPDECDIATGFSEDCNNNGTADECESNSGDRQWIGGDGGDFGLAANWSPTGAPGDAGNALISNSGSSDNRCILGDNGLTLVCSATVSASGSGRQYLQINAGSVLETNEQTTIDVGGSLDLRGGEVSGGPVYNNSNTITGFGYITTSTFNQGLIVPMIGERLRFTGSAFENQTGGTLRSGTASLTHVMSSGVSQEGALEVQSLGAIVFDQPLLNAAGGSISLLNGTLATGGLTNAVGASLSGFGVIQSSFTNHGDVNLIADTQVLGDLDNEGTIVMQSGLLTITGNLSGGGAIIGGFGGRGGDGGLHVRGDFTLGAAARFAMDGGRLMVEGDLDIAIADGSGLDLRGAEIDMIEGVGRGDRSIEALAADVGPRAGARSETDLFRIGTLRIGARSTGVRLVNRHANGAARREALYVDHLILERGARLDLAGLNLYYKNVTPADPMSNGAGVLVTDSRGGGGLQPMATPDAARRSP